jgi:molybdopterin-guanine dinucleotide biosynthesis protein A
MPHGGTLVEHVFRVAQQVAGAVVLLGDNLALPPSLAHVRRLPDDPHGAGPAAGLAALLQYAGDRWVLLLSCDLPRLSMRTLRPLLAVPRDHVDAVVFRSVDHHARLEACCALYHARLLPLIRRSLHEGTASLQRILAFTDVREVSLPAGESQALHDLDTRADAARFLAEVSSNWSRSSRTNFASATTTLHVDSSPAITMDLAQVRKNEQPREVSLTGSP